MKKIIKFNKKFMSFFLAVMMINTMVFTGHKVLAATTGLTISVNDSSNQSIPQYTNSGGNTINTQFSNPVRLAANATAKISYNFTNATTAKYQFVQASNVTTLPQFPQDSTMTNINLPAPNSQAAYGNDIGPNGTISTMQYVYAGNPSTASSTAQLTRDVSFGTPLSSTMLVQNAIQGSDIPNYTVSGSTAFLPNTTVYTGSSKSRTSTYYVWNPFSNYYMTPSKNAAWKAMKFWGYISPPNSGYYNLGANSDDGAYGYIIVNGQTKEFVNDWSIAAAFNRTDNNPIYLTANSYYPIYMEWYEGCPTNAAFTPVYQFSSKSSTSALSSSWANIPQNYFYSSKTTTPGTIPGAYFGDVSGIPFPNQDGIYYIATKFVSGEGTTSGLYGPFIIDTTPPTINNLSVVSNNSTSNKKAVAGNTLTVNFTASEALQGNPQILINGYVANATYTNISGNNYTATVNIGNDASIDSSGDEITNGPITVRIAQYSDLSGNVGSSVQDNSVTFISNNLGITLALTQNPTSLTNGNVVVTASATAYGNGNSIKTMKYASGSQSVNYFTAGGTNLTINPLTSSNNSNGILQSPVQSTFNVNTNGVYTVYATDNLGNVAVQTIDVENIYVTPPVITAPTNGTITNDNKPTIKGTGEAGATVTVYDNGKSIGTALVQSDGTWSLTLTTALSDGTHPITAKQQDAAGNVSAVSNTVNLTIVPSAPVITSPTDGTSTSNNKPTISGTGQAGDTVTVYDGTTAIGTATVGSNGSWSMTVTAALADGKNVITATQTDSGGNVSGASNTVNLTIVPSAPVITSPTDGISTNNNKPTISGTGQAGDTVTVYDGTTTIGTATVGSNGSWSMTVTAALADGKNVITATQTDSGGNVSGASNTVNLTIVPSAPVITAPADGTITNNNKPTIKGTGEAGATVTVYDNGTSIGTALVQSDGTWSLTLTTALSDGTHPITAKQQDAAGNVSAVSNTVNLTIDTVAPAAPVITAPTNGTITNNNKPTIKGTGEAGATVTVYDNGTSIGTALAQSDGTWSLALTTALSDGTHPITAKQQDAAGNVSAVSNTVNITIDTTVPAAPVITTPANNTVTKNNTPTISGTAEANSTVNVYDGTTLIGTVTADGTGNWTLTPSTGLADGTHTIKATSTDAAGNVSPESNTVNIIIDTTPPTLTLTQNPTTATNGTVTITATASDNVAVASITKPDNTVVTDSTTTDYTVSANGTYTFKATDTAGNVTTQSITVSNITATVKGTVRDITTNNPISGATVSTDGGATATTGEDGTYTLNNVSAGSPTITATAQGYSSQSFTPTSLSGGTVYTQDFSLADITAPTLTLTQSPTSTTSGSVTITATASDTGSGVASITKPDRTVVTDSTTTYTVSDNDTYTFTATDKAGNVATQSITVSNIIDGQSIILAHGLYNGSGTGISNDNPLAVTNSIPVTMAMEVDVESSSPEINWSWNCSDNSGSKIIDDNIVFNKYEILDDGTLGNPETTTLNNSGNINLTGITMEKGEKYIIVYTITPVGNGTVTVTATADGTSSKSVDLNMGAQPDLF